MCVWLRECVFMFVILCMCVIVCAYVYACDCEYMCICTCVCDCVYVCIYVWFCACVCDCVSMYVWLRVCMSVYDRVHTSAHVWRPEDSFIVSALSSHLRGFWGAGIRSSGLHWEHFLCWAISQPHPSSALSYKMLSQHNDIPGASRRSWWQHMHSTDCTPLPGDCRGFVCFNILMSLYSSLGYQRPRLDVTPRAVEVATMLSKNYATSKACGKFPCL